MVQVEFVGGPWNGRIVERSQLEHSIRVKGQEALDTLRLPYVASIYKPVFQHFVYRVRKYEIFICDNVICRWKMESYVATLDCPPLHWRPKLWVYSFELKPKPDFLNRFELWFLWTAYWYNAPCREVRNLECEIRDAIDLFDFTTRYKFASGKMDETIAKSLRSAIGLLNENRRFNKP